MMAPQAWQVNNSTSKNVSGRTKQTWTTSLPQGTSIAQPRMVIFFMEEAAPPVPTH